MGFLETLLGRRREAPRTNPKALNNDASTLLMWAAGLGRTALVDLLIAQGANQEARDDQGYTAADYAEIYRSTGSVK
jgi:ankyrin repeat protein